MVMAGVAGLLLGTALVAALPAAEQSAPEIPLILERNRWVPDVIKVKAACDKGKRSVTGSEEPGPPGAMAGNGFYIIYAPGFDPSTRWPDLRCPSR